ncbi:ABC transporter ATP-binding protein [Paracoccus aminophilus]|uniref:Iron complex transport system ATP-binding protein n=1 Tax=Paracoccus aminophilus JCM 7686 TaxID=1367847 RepID=S5YZW7_PARAH|nr:ABC transporter ATP-binding protein [Paracoccus aminophilus]AGT10751.1 iron complex transport system ATP-binding protein [Paracoccus aminophilus JCM 7686]
MIETETTQMSGPIFAVRNLSVTLGGAAILRDLSFEITPGITGLIGANGCGKTTLLRSLAGVLRPTAGEIRHRGQDLARLSPKTRARAIALLPQTGEAPPGLTVRELVARGRTPWLRPFLPLTPADHQAVARAIAATGMGDLAHRRVESLSGGQRQRAWIGLVLAQESGTILLDEPLNFLDLPHQAELVRLLKTLSAKRQIVIIIHDLTLAARLCDQIIALRDGALIAHGPTAEVLAAAPLERAFAIPFDCVETASGPVVLPRGI